MNRKAAEFASGPVGADGRPGRPAMMVAGSFKVMVYELATHWREAGRRGITV